MNRPTIEDRFDPPLNRLATARHILMPKLIGEVLATYLAKHVEADVTFAERSRPRAAGCEPRWPASPSVRMGYPAACSGATTRPPS
jgi:hypothetical protein